MKRLCVIAVLLLGMGALLAGCETGKGLSKGVTNTALGAASTVYYTGTGLAQDTYTGYRHTASFLDKVDSWMRENLW